MSAADTKPTYASAAFRRRAVLIGIRTWPFIPPARGGPLAGCHNDVVAIRDVLAAHGFADDDLDVLVDFVDGCPCPFCKSEHRRPSPTRQGILDALERLHDACAEGDVAVVYYSGHGSEFAGRGLRVGRRFQTFVPHDSGRGEAENRDIADLEIDAWIRRMGRRTPYLTMILDCCHSGGMGDLRGDASSAARRVEADDRDAVYLSENLRLAVECDNEETRGDGGKSLILLAACAADELSSETEADGRKHGLFTSRLTTALQNVDAKRLNWSDVFPDVAHSVNESNLGQHPRRAGDGPIFAPGSLDLDDVDPPDVIELAKLAVVIGIDYRREDAAAEDSSAEGFSPLRAPHADAEEVARVLAEEQGYEIVGYSKKSPGPLLGRRATRRRIVETIQRLAAVKARSRGECAVVVYFAGHGMVQTDENGEQRGYLIPWDADPADPSTWWAMSDLRDQLVEGVADEERLQTLGREKPLKRLVARHLLLVLDCCFGGALGADFFRGAAEDAEGGGARPVYYSEYKRFVEGTAWQLLNSASFRQQALDRDPRDPDDPYSPFAKAFLEGLKRSAADQGRGDHIITASELHQHIDRRLRESGLDVQTPGLSDLRPRDGQFIFHVPGFEPKPAPDPPLHPDANPWPGDAPYDIGDSLFCGREEAIVELLRLYLDLSREIREGAPASLVVYGPSGCGAGSLLRAGLASVLRDPVAGRRSLRAWLRRSEQDHFLLSRDDVRVLRDWCEELGLMDDDPETAVETIRAWAIDQHLLTSPGTARSRVVLQSLGIPSFDGDEHAASGAVRRSGVLKTLDRPAIAASWLNLWNEKRGIVDFLSVSDRALRGLIGAWRIVEWQDLIEEDASGEELRLAAARAEPEALDALPASARRFRVPRPDRDALRRIVQEPAAARVLDFESADLVERLVDEADASAAPLALLSQVLAEMVERAWRRRGTKDRILTGADTDDPEAPIGAWLAARAQTVYESFDEPLREAFEALWRRCAATSEDRVIVRRVHRRELEWIDEEKRRRLQVILEQCIRARLIVVDETHYVLVSKALLDRLPPWIVRWEESMPAGSPEKLWRAAVQWEESQFSRDKLSADRAWTNEQRRRIASGELNHLEETFLDASWVSCRIGEVERLRGQAMDALWADWPKACETAIRLAVESKELQAEVVRLLAKDVTEVFDAKLDPGLELRQAHNLCRMAGEQTLRDVLSATPHSVPLRLPAQALGEFEGLGFGRGGRKVYARIGGVVWSWSTEAPDASARREAADRLETGAGEVSPERVLFMGPVEDHPPVPSLLRPGQLRGPHVQNGSDVVICFFSAGHLALPPALRPSPISLLGHRSPPTYLTFSRLRSPRFLASAGVLDDGRAEIRLWPLDEQSMPITEPRQETVDARSSSETPSDASTEKAALGRRALGREAGRAALDWTERAEPSFPTTLPAPSPGWQIVGIDFDLKTRALHIERRTIFYPFEHRIDVYALDLDELLRLARCRVGADFDNERGDDPPEGEGK